MKLRSFYSILVGAVAVLLLTSLAGAYWLTGSPVRAAAPSLEASRPSAALFVSRQSPGMVSLLTNPERLTSFWLAELSRSGMTEPAGSRSGSRKAAQPGQGLKQRLAQVQQSLFGQLGLNYDRDIKSWLGNEVTFALMATDVDHDPTNGDQPGYLLALAVQDPVQAEAALTSFWQRRSPKRLVEQVAGIEVIQAEAETEAEDNRPAPILTSALVGNRYVLFANYPAVLRSALTNAQVAELNLENSFAYQQALEQFPDPQTGLLYIDLTQPANPLLAKLAALTGTGENLGQVGQEQSLSTRPEPAQTALPEASRLIAALKPTPQGLLVDTVLLTAQPNPNPEGKLVNASSLLQFIPTRSHLAIASQDFSQTWSQWNWLIGSTWKPALTKLQQQIGIPLPEDLATWMEGNFALAELPGATGSDWVLVTQQSPTTTAGLQALDQRVQEQGMSVGSFQFDNQTVYAWTKLVPRGAGLEAAVQGVHTQFDSQIGSYEVLATSLEALKQALSPNLAGEFQQALAQIRTPNQGYLYFDRPALKQVLSDRSIKLDPALLASLQSALLSSYGKTETGWQGALLLSLDRT
jgi:hypothetical protein